MSNQLIKTTELGKENVFPRTRILDLFDDTSGLKLIDIFRSFNMMFVPYLGNKPYTRNQISPELRRQGLWLTYVIDNTVYTEWYGEVAIDDTNWGSDSNWRQGSNALVGDLSVSPNGTWVINGEDSGITIKGDKGDSPVIRIYDNKIQVSYNKGITYEDLNNTPVYTKFRFNSLTNTYLVSYDLGANWLDISDEKVYHKFKYNLATNTYQESLDFGKTWSNVSAEKVYYQFRYNAGTNTHLVSTDLGLNWTDISSNKVFYQFRTNDNRLLVSTDLGTTWENCSEPIAAWFRWASGDTADSVGKILISRDLLNWSDLSPNMTNNLYIKGYVAVIGNLPSNAAIGDIYMVGPTYDESDTTHDYPHYRMWVKLSSGWIDNGEYLSNVLISLTTGLETGITMSQKATTDAIQAMQKKLSELDSEVAYLSNSTIGSELCNIPNTMIVAKGDSEGTESKWKNASASDYISCVGGSTLILTTESSTGSSGIAFYNKSKEVIVGYGKTYSKQTNVEIPIPLDAHFLRYTSFKNESLSILFSNGVAENRNNLEDAIWYNTFAGTLSIDTEEATIHISNGYLVSPKYATSILANGETINYVLTNYSLSIIYLKSDGSLHFDSYGQHGTYNNKKELTDRILAVVRFASNNKTVAYVNHICQSLTIDGIEYSTMGIAKKIEEVSKSTKDTEAELRNTIMFGDEILNKGIYWCVDNGVIKSQLNDRFGSIKSKLERGESIIFSTKGGLADARAYIWIPDSGDIVLSDALVTLENYMFTADSKGLLILNCRSEYYENFKYYKKRIDDKEDSGTNGIIYKYSDSFMNGYIYAATANLSIGDNIWDKETEAFDGMGCAKIRIVKGDVVKLSIYGGSLARGYVITDIEGNVKAISDEYVDSVNGEIITYKAEENGFIYINTYTKNEPQNVWVKINRKVIPTLIYCVKENNVNNGYYVVGDKIGETLTIFAYPNDSFIHLDLVKVFSGDIVRLKAISGVADARAYALVDEEFVCYEVAESNTDYSVNEAVVNVRKNGYIMVSTKTIDNFRVVVERFENHRENEIISRKYINAPYPYNNETLKVLVLGNSFCDDANSYLGELIDNSGLDKSKLSIVTHIIGGSTFKVWIDTINDNLYKSPYHVIGNYSMNSTGYIKDIISLNWDVVVIQMGSDSSHIYTNYRYITEYLMLLRTLCTNQKVCIVWQPAWGRQDNNDENEYKIYSEMAKRFINEYGIDYIIPTNTAIQYARETGLKGDYNLVRDGRHLCLGVGRYIAASMWFQMLISPVFNISLKSITANHSVTSEEINKVNAIYGMYAEVGAIDVTDDNRLLCQDCVLKASVNMFI